MSRTHRFAVPVIVLAAVGITLTALFARTAGPGVRLDDSVTSLGHEVSSDEIARLLGLEVWRFRCEPQPGETDRLLALRLREPGRPVREFGGSSVFWDDLRHRGGPSEIVVVIRMETIEGRHWLRFSSEETVGGNHVSTSRNGPTEIPRPLEGRRPETPVPIAEHEYAIRWAQLLESGNSSGDVPDPVTDTIWSIYLGPVPEGRRLPREE